jgi:hypothetical protein
MKKLLLVLMVIPFVLKAAAYFNNNAQKIDIRVSSGTPNYKTAEEFNNYNLGTFSNTSYLHIMAAESWITKNNGSDVTAIKLYYRIYKQGATPPAFSEIDFSWQENSGESQRWGNYSVDIDVLSQVTSAGTWYIEIYYQGTTNGVDCSNPIYYSNFGNNFKPYFVADNTLPVELSSFTAAIQNKSVVLNWATATEINNYGFVVERSFDKVNWNKIGFKNGYGNSNSVKDYSYIDNDITKNGMYYYRLKQIDNNGNYEYSNVIEVNVNIPVKFEVLQNYPNPFNPVTNISFTLPEATNVTLYIFNAIGQQIKAVNAGYRESGKHTIEFDGSDLNSGIYFYKVEAGKNSTIRKMALIK